MHMNPSLMTLQVTAKRPVAKDIHFFELRDPGHCALPSFTAGAHIAIHTPSGSVRQYSLCNDPAQTDCYQIAVKREANGRGGSISMVEELQLGQSVLVGQPVNQFPLDERAQRYLLIAGGIGITPMLSMAHHLSFAERPFTLYYLTRDAESTAFLGELSAQPFAANVKIHHDQGDPQKGLDLWPLLEKPGSLTSVHVYCCGPAGLMEAVRDMTGHWPASTVHFESFGVRNTVQADDQAFTVHFKRSGQHGNVPVGQTILETARQMGIQMAASCESGTCGSCKTLLLEGEADHRDHVLMPEEKGQWIMPCVSRARTASLTIDA